MLLSRCPTRSRRPAGARLADCPLLAGVCAPRHVTGPEAGSGGASRAALRCRHLINSPTSACIALNLGAALFGSNQVRGAGTSVLSWTITDADGWLPQVAIKYAEGTLTPGAMSALRFGIAALCFAPNAWRGFRNPALRSAAVELGLYLFGVCSVALRVCSSLQLKG